MKTQIIVLAALLTGAVGFAQKNEIKEAEKALKSGDAVTAKATLEGASGLIASADERTQAQYYYLLGRKHKQRIDCQK